MNDGYIKIKKYMNNDVFCPDCNSQDIQKIGKDLTIVKERGLAWWAIVLLVIIYPAGIIYLLLKCFGLFKFKSKIKTETETYYVCRSCGHEFRNNKLDGDA